MKKLNIVMIIVAILLFNVSAFAGEGNVYHVVLLNLKEGVTPEQTEDMITVGKALLSQIPGVLEVSLGKKALDNRDIHIKDYDMALCVKWETIETGKVYGPHTLHKSFLKLYGPLVSGMKIMDFYGN